MKLSKLDIIFKIFWPSVSLVLVAYSFYLLVTEGFSQDFFNFFVAGHVLGITQQLQIKK